MVNWVACRDSLCPWMVTVHSSAGCRHHLRKSSRSPDGNAARLNEASLLLLPVIRDAESRQSAWSPTTTWQSTLPGPNVSVAGAAVAGAMHKRQIPRGSTRRRRISVAQPGCSSKARRIRRPTRSMRVIATVPFAQACIVRCVYRMPAAPTTITSRALIASLAFGTSMALAQSSSRVLNLTSPRTCSQASHSDRGAAARSPVRSHWPGPRAGCL